MPVDDDVVLGSFGCHTLVEVHHPLVGMVHEVDLHCRYTPFGIGLEESVEVVVCREPGKPQHYLHTLGIAILDEVGQTQAVVAVKGVACGLCPAFVQKDVLDAVFSGKVGKVAVSLIVAASLEIDIWSVGRSAVPPFP